MHLLAAQNRYFLGEGPNTACRPACWGEAHRLSYDGCTVPLDQMRVHKLNCFTFIISTPVVPPTSQRRVLATDDAGALTANPHPPICASSFVSILTASIVPRL